MNNYCRHCGFKLENEMQKCPKCGAEIFEERINVEVKQKELTDFKKKENRYVIAILSLFGLSYLLSNFLKYEWVDEVTPILWFSAVIILIYARITMNESKKIKVMFNIALVLLIIYFVFVLLLVVACTSVLSNSSGCGF